MNSCFCFAIFSSIYHFLLSFGMGCESSSSEQEITQPERKYKILSHEVGSERVIKSCIKNDNPLVDYICQLHDKVMR